MGQQIIAAVPGDIVIFKFRGSNPPSHEALTKAFGPINDKAPSAGTHAKIENIHAPYLDKITSAEQVDEQQDCVMKCITRQLGINTIIEMAAIGIGAPVVKKRFVTPGSSPRTSIASKYISKAIPKRYEKLPRRIWAPTTVRPLALTKSTGRVTARWIPFIGWGLLSYMWQKSVFAFPVVKVNPQ